MESATRRMAEVHSRNSDEIPVHGGCNFCHFGRILTYDLLLQLESRPVRALGHHHLVVLQACKEQQEVQIVLISFRGLPTENPFLKS